MEASAPRKRASMLESIEAEVSMTATSLPAGKMRRPGMETTSGQAPSGPASALCRRDGRKNVRSVRVSVAIERWRVAVQSGGGSMVARTSSSIQAGVSPNVLPPEATSSSSAAPRRIFHCNSRARASSGEGSSSSPSPLPFSASSSSSSSPPSSGFGASLLPGLSFSGAPGSWPSPSSWRVKLPAGGALGGGGASVRSHQMSSGRVPSSSSS